MSDYDYDLFVIGAGSGGVRAARLSAMTGARVAIAEEYRVGGTCVVRGCVPKKFFVYASEYGHAFQDAQGYGWSADNVRFSWPKLLANKDAEIDRLSGIYVRNLTNAGVEIIEERAEFEDAHTVRLKSSGRTITAKHILIATGGRPFRPLDLPGQELAITSEEAFHLETLPKHIVVAGGGYIAVEFAGIFNGLGVETCLVYRGETVLRGFDEDVRTHVHAELKRKGVRVITHTVFESLEQTETGIRCTLTNGTKLDSDAVMFAIDRTPHTHGLGLEKAGVQTCENGAVAVDAFSKTNVDHIYAVGDVTDRNTLTPVAIREGAAFAQTVFGGKPTRFDHSDVPNAVFSQPPVGSVGLSEAEARRKFGRVDIYKSTFKPMKYALSGNEERTLMKLVVEPEVGRVVGAHIVGPDGPEIIQAVAIAVKAGLTKAQFDATCALHPTLAEELVTLREKYVPPEMLAAE
ncbi:MAG: glutathione-disulfide reductase [Maricaulaceae bacterium]